MGSEFEAIPEFTMLQNRMRQFIADQGGAIPFDAFMQESLYGRTDSYYQSRVNIDYQINGGDWPTYAIRPYFAELLSRPIFRQLSEFNGQGQLVELGGGTGAFKANILKLGQDQGLKFKYISIDNSRKLHHLQAQYGGESYLTSALNLPLADRSVNGVIFANELVDAFPVRYLRAVITNDVFSHFEELRYRVKRNNIEHQWLPADDAQIREYWLRQREVLELTDGFSWDWDILNHQMMAVNTLQADLIRECSRVLNKGKIILIDYGNTIYNLLRKGAKWTIFASPDHLNTNVENMHRLAYFADLSALVNFSDLEIVARQSGLTVQWYGPQRHFLWEQITSQEEVEVKKQLRENPTAYTLNIQLLKNEGSDGTSKVLVLTRSGAD
ncbi:hypothetical protein A2154_04705 [Candidatus Gottesmanbacteria bacterium RBG_16_43_7]|uniref:Uncharacterized protein n=1 Tax=Candidatus Gottesmanbacteria bacterium RBG_16_43_7 TaxID=1798373 RepID=A0A1F5Z7N4_9BACT|nr:MAG: hypothetical protein A2154_04705 [Candidatus Gottesmanbacteria bacterium RBG_16_43_7]